MLSITDRIRIPEEELQWSFVRSAGPGGQNVNKVASKAVLRWNVAASAALPVEVKMRFLAQNQGRISEAGDLLISSQRFRDQPRNKQDCLAKLRELVLQALIRPKKRRPTRPTRASKERRLEEKKRRSTRKTSRRGPKEE
jgi:ribosome-associated protein